MDQLLQSKPFSLNATSKNNLFLKSISLLNQHHYENCKGYSFILDVFGYAQTCNSKVEDFLSYMSILLKIIIFLVLIIRKF